MSERGTPVEVPHIDFDTPTGNPLVTARKGYGLTNLAPERRYPPPPPYEPDLDVICWIEDPRHGPSRPKTWRCWIPFRKCPHQRERP